MRAVENRPVAFELRKQGYTYREIAGQMGVSIKTAHGYVNDYWHEIKDTTDELAEVVRDRELANLDAWHKTWAPEVLRTENPEMAMKIIDRLLKIQERRAKLLGLEAPAKVDMMTGVKMDPEKILAAVREFSPALYNHRQAPA
ncbi:MAG: hypothetical protein M3463_04460 [Verrucomicrobiota bacterium]|nr:hypothetical protein [Verrucomicrobiota bacterium]